MAEIMVQNVAYRATVYRTGTYPKGPEAANKWQMQVFNGAWDEEGGSIFVK